MLKLSATIALLLAMASGTAMADAGHKESPDQHMSEMMADGKPGMMGEGMLALPMMDPAQGRSLFVSKGCVVCHAINGVGGEDAPQLDASTMKPMMNPFEFAARMWRGAEAMVALQRDELGEPIELTGKELADIIAFVHSHKEQKTFTDADVPEKMKKLIAHEDEGEHGHGHKE